MIKESEYMFASSFLKAADSVGTAAERLSRFSEAGSISALHTAVCEAFRIPAPTADADSGEVYDAAFCDAVDKIRGAVPDFSVFCPLLYKYDCTNVKIAIKSSARGIEISDKMLFRSGSVPCESILKGAENGHFIGLPPEMEKAAFEARETLGKTGEVRAVDLILDRACFADMKSGADEGGVELIQTVTSMRADAVNILAAMRISASGMPPESASALMERAFVPGGGISASVFSSHDGCPNAESICSAAGNSLLLTILRRACTEHDTSFARCEKLFDEAILSECDKYRFKPFGPEIAVRFLLIREAEIMNARIIEAGISAGQSTELIKERLREAYV